MTDANKVLVIDDDDLILKTLGNVLAKQGYFYRLAGDAETALKHVAENEFDIILADIRMPVMNGVDAVKKIQDDRKRQNRIEIPIIFITGYADDGMHFKAGRLGEVIQKPFNLDQLMITMREYL